MQSSVVKGDKGRLGDLCVSMSSAGNKMAFAKLKAYFKLVLQKIHRLLYTVIYSVHIYLRYSRRRSPRGYVKLGGGRGGSSIFKGGLLPGVYGIQCSNYFV